MGDPRGVFARINFVYAGTMEHDDVLAQRANGRLGTVLCGKYTVERVLGVGGMAVVYGATHRNRKQVAIKMLHAELSLHPEIHKRFLREGYVANSVKHKGAVDIIDDDVAEDGAAFLVMELLDGAPVDTIAAQREGKLPVGAALAIGYELCGVLAAAHANEIVHRDIKPANLFVTREGDLKVLDFGIARLRDASSAQATNTGMMLGTPAFMAPEQAMGRTEEVGAATDIWAVGATLFHLLTGLNVHEADTAQLMLIRTATVPARSIAEVMPSLPPAIAAVVDKALKFDRRERWESAASMRSALREAYVASFGGFSAASILAPLVGGAAKGSSVPAPANATPSAVAVAATDIAAVQTGPRAQPAPRVAGATTANPVSSSFIQPIASKKSIGVAAIALVLAGGIGGFAWTRASETKPVAGAATSGAGMVQATASTPSTPEPPVASAAPSVSASTVSAPSASVATPTAVTRPAAVVRTTLRVAPSAAPATQATSAAVSPKPPPPPPTVDIGAVR
jgi:serine/threonine-protein kinase